MRGATTPPQCLRWTHALLLILILATCVWLAVPLHACTHAHVAPALLQGALARFGDAGANEGAQVMFTGKVRSVKQFIARQRCNLQCQRCYDGGGLCAHGETHVLTVHGVEMLACTL